MTSIACHRSSAFAVAAAAAVLLAACSSTPVEQPKPMASAAAAPPSAAPARSTPPPAVAAATPRANGGQPAHLDAASELLRQHSVYFEFDDASIGDSFRSVVERHGRYLSEHAGVRMVVQGNTDERGSSEYNLALGQRRAQAVKTALALYGAKDAQVEAVSYGEEKPASAGHDEQAWRQNRRADLVYAR
jgi:peptidoglycan-associated lipoprotein